LCADIGKKLGCGGTMAALCRTQAAGYPLSATHTLEEFESMSDEERRAAVIPPEEIFPTAEKLVLPAFYARLARNGQPIYLKKIGRTDPLGTYLRLYDGDAFFALGEVREEEGGIAVRPVRQF
jgi:tRNA pseudouridine55 synthase